MNPSIQKLAQLMQERQKQKETPYVLLLGSSLSLTPAVRCAFAGTEDWEAFWKKMERTSPTERKALLKEPLDALDLEPGYQAVARLAGASYFNLVLTLNVDDTIDDAVRPLPADQSVLLIYDGSNAAQIVAALPRATPRLKVVKLRGDINAQALPLTDTGQFEFPDALEQSVSEWLRGDTILVGDIPYDTDVQRCIRQSTGALWCILPDEPARDSFIRRAKRSRPSGEIITGADAEFNTFFTTLAEEILGKTVEHLPGAFGDVFAYCASLTRLPEYARWADRLRVREEGEDYYIETESKILPLLASPYDDIGQQRQDLLEIIRTHERLLVLGEPGVGKTAALERMVWETANARKAVVPIYVPLSYYDGNLLGEVQSALVETGVLHFSKLRDVDTFLRRNQCLVLFDGLNEVRRDQRRNIVRDIANFVRAYRRHRFVFTSRSQDPLWQSLRDEKIISDAVVVQRITDEQVREYLIAHLGDQKGRQTHDSLNECLRGMSRTLLFLWMLKEVRLAGRELPGNRGELFDEFVEKAVFTQDERKLEISIPRSAKKQALAYLAFTLQGEHRVACQEEEAMTIVSEAGEKYDPQDLIHEAQVHGLLKGKRQVRLMHQAVQEYFAALALREIVAAEVKVPALQQLGKRVLRRGLAAWARDPWWAESFVQLAGLTDHPSWLAREVVRINPWLAFWCMIEGRPVDERTRRDVEAGTVDLLRSEDVRKRRRAVRELGKLENPRTAEYLVTVLGDEAEEVVDMAIQGLGKLGEPAIEYLYPYLEKDEGVRQAATRALGLVWQIPPLVDLGKAESLRLAALEALGQLGDTRTVGVIVAVARRDTDMAVRRRAVEALGQIGDTRAVGPLLAVLHDDEPSLRTSAATALGQIGDERAVEPLTEALKDNDETVRRKAVSALGQIWESPHLVHLGDNRKAVRRDAAAALGSLGDVQAVQPLVATLRDQDGVVCARAAIALGQLGDARAAKPLISVLLTGPEPAARTSAAEALGKLGDRRAVEPLIVALKDQELNVQRSAAMALGRLGAERAIEPLIAICKGRDVQGSAVKALAQIGSLAVPPLVVALIDGERGIRINAARALGQIGGTEALEALLVSLRDDRDGIVRVSAAVALGQVGGARAVEGLVATLRGDKDRTVRVYAAMSLGRIGGVQAIRALITTLKDKDEGEAVRQMAINALGRIWNLPHLVRLSSGNPTVRRGAAVALGQLGDKRAIEPLLTTLRDQDKAVRRRTISALGRIWDLPQLVQLGDDEAGTRQRAALDLGQLGDVRAVEPLIAALRDSNAAVRLATTRALGQLDDERAVQPLIEALDDHNKDVRRAAGEALQCLAPWAISGLIIALRDSRYWFRRRRAAETLGRIGESGPLIEALWDHDRYVRRNAIEALVRVGDAQAVEPLIGVLRDDDNYVRRKAAEALGKIGGASAVKPLGKALQYDDDWRVRWVVAEAMGDIGDPSAVESLSAALEDDKWPVRWMAAKALGKIGDPRAVKPLIKALESDWPALWTVAEALGELEDPHAVGSLVAVLRDSEGDEYIQHTAVEALGQIGEPIQRPLIALLRGGDKETQQRAIAALGQLGDVRNLDPLIAALRDEKWSVHHGARKALTQIGKAAVEPLIAVLQDDDPFVRRRAILALGEIGDARAVGPLIATLQDEFPIVRREAAEALYTINTPQARAALREYEKTGRRANAI